MIGEHGSMLLCGHAWRLWRARIHQGTTSKPFNSACITRFLHVIERFASFREVKKSVRRFNQKFHSNYCMCIIHKLLHHFALFLFAILCSYIASLHPGEYTATCKLHMCLTDIPSTDRSSPFLFIRRDPGSIQASWASWLRRGFTKKSAMLILLKFHTKLHNSFAE